MRRMPYAAHSSRRYHCVAAGGDRVTAVTFWWRLVEAVLGGAVVRQFYAGERISACCLVFDIIIIIIQTFVTRTVSANILNLRRRNMKTAENIYLALKCNKLLLLHPFNSFFSRTTCVSRHQNGKPFWILLEQKMMGWPWHQLDHMQIICTPDR